MLDRKQYNAAVKYLEKNSFRVNKSDFIFYITLTGIVGYFIVLYILKLSSCL